MKKFVLLALPPVFVTKLPAQKYAAPKANAGNTTIIAASEVNAAAKNGEDLAVADSVLRVVSIEGKYNIGVSVVSRSKINGKTPLDTIVHYAVTRGYHIIDEPQISQMDLLRLCRTVFPTQLCVWILKVLALKN